MLEGGYLLTPGLTLKQKMRDLTRGGRVTGLVQTHRIWVGVNPGAYVETCGILQILLTPGSSLRM